MYINSSPETLTLYQDDSKLLATIPMSNFAFITSGSHSQNGLLALTAIRKDAKLPSIKENSKGDLRLFIAQWNNPNWQQVGKFYAHDVQLFPQGNFGAFHTGNGLGICDLSTGEIHKQYKLGKFNWGAPCISISPSAKYVVGAKWRGM